MGVLAELCFRIVDGRWALAVDTPRPAARPVICSHLELVFLGLANRQDVAFAVLEPGNTIATEISHIIVVS